MSSLYAGPITAKRHAMKHGPFFSGLTSNRHASVRDSQAAGVPFGGAAGGSATRSVRLLLTSYLKQAQPW